MPIIQLRDGPLIRCLNDVLTPHAGDHVRARTDEGTTMKMTEPVILQGVTQLTGKQPTLNGMGTVMRLLTCSVCGYTEIYNEKIALTPAEPEVTRKR